MNAEHAPDRRTREFARVLGPFLMIVPLAAAVRAPKMHTLLEDFAANPLWPWVVGAFILVLGLIVVAVHTSWSNPPAVVISVVGWLLELRGVVLLAFPEAFMTAANAVIGANLAWRIGYVALALIGLYLTYVGWRPAPERATAPVS